MKVRQRKKIDENSNTVALRQGLGIVSVQDQLVQEEQEPVSLDEIASL